MKKTMLIIGYLVFINISLFSQVTDEIRQRLITIYTGFANATTIEDKVKFIRNPNDYVEILKARYVNRNMNYNPIRFGECILASPSRNIYVLEEFVQGSRGGQSTEIKQMRYFIYTNNEYKIDWEASFAYNPVTWTRFKALEDGNSVEMRCYATLDRSSYDDYFAIDLRDELTNFQITGYVSKRSELGLILLDELESGQTRPYIFELQFRNDLSRYSKHVMINRIVLKGWVK